MKKAMPLVVDGHVDMAAFRDRARISGEAWAARQVMNAYGHDAPKGPIMWHGCAACGGYGQPGWYVKQSSWTWEKCKCHDPTRSCLPMCSVCGEYATANTCGVCSRCLDSREGKV